MLKFSHTVHCSSTVIPFCLKRSVLAPISWRPALLITQSALIGQLTHTWEITANNSSAAVLNQPQDRNYANAWHSDVVWCHNVTVLKAGAADEVFQDQWFLWERGASVGADFDLFHFQDILLAQEHIQ